MRLPWRRQPRTALEAARAAYQAASRYGNVDRGRLAGDWGDRAVAAGDVQAAAEAYWERVIAGAQDAVRHIPVASRRKFLDSSRGVLAEAGYRQVEAGDAERAARILEFGRGVQLRRTVGAVTPAQRATLDRIGRHDLRTGYQAAVAELARLLRGQFRPVPAPRGVGAGPLRGHDPLLAAGEAVDALERRIAEELNVPGGPPPYSEIRAAATEAPLIYLAAAREGGYALLITARGGPTRIALPQLTHDRAAELAGALGERAGVEDVPAEPVRRAVEWLEECLAGLIAETRGHPVVTLVAIGMLSLLPVHAVLAGVGVAVQHTPSALALPAARLVSPEAGVLTVVAARPAQLPEAKFRALDHAQGQARELSRLYGHRYRGLSDARADDVLAALHDAEICHFVCHGVYSAGSPLDSALVLADRRLTVAEILARDPGRHRLVVLGACESSVPDKQMLDETVSFPGAMLQAGAEGVVAALWRVRELPAALVLLRLHEGVLAGRPPAVALTEAQRWLRTTTWGDMTARYPEVAKPSRIGSPDRVRFAEPADWAAFTYTGA